MKRPQIAVIVLFACSIVLHGIKHGENKGEYNIGGSIIEVGIRIFVLYSGGFFNLTD